MAKTEHVISCPFCRRIYRMMLDREIITTNKTRASCGRCGNSFALATRIVVANATVPAGTRRPSPMASPPPPPPPPRKRPVDPRTADDDPALNDLVRDIARAADHIAAVPEASAESQRTAQLPAMPTEPLDEDRAAHVEPAAEGGSPPPMDEPVSVPVPPPVAPTALAPEPSSATTNGAPAAVTASPPPVAAPPPRGWLERAEPSLDALATPATRAEQLLSELLPPA